MRITVKQLKTLIREVTEEAMEENSGSEGGNRHGHGYAWESDEDRRDRLDAREDVLGLDLGRDDYRYNRYNRHNRYKSLADDRADVLDDRESPLRESNSRYSNALKETVAAAFRAGYCKGRSRR